MNINAYPEAFENYWRVSRNYGTWGERDFVFIKRMLYNAWCAGRRYEKRCKEAKQ
jgi:hypothetical protein